MHEAFTHLIPKFLTVTLHLLQISGHQDVRCKLQQATTAKHHCT